MRRVVASFLAMAAVALASGGPAMGAAATVPAHSDPVIGPNARAEAGHLHDSLHFTPATASPIARNTSVRRVAGVRGIGPAAPTSAGSAGTLTREVFAFAPYWELSSNAQVGWNYSLVSTLAYFSLNMYFDGTFSETSADPGWNGWNSAALVDMVNRAHLAGDRVVLTIKCFDESAINGIVTVNWQTAITNTLNMVASKNLDGVNVDFEGRTDPNFPNIQSGFTSFMTQLTKQAHARNGGWQVTADTYNGSASWDGGIFKIGDLAPVVDGLFVMAYDMAFGNMPGQAGPNAPLTGFAQGNQEDDTLSMTEYLSKAPASKVILGTPYYGYKYTTPGSTLYSQIKSGSGATAVSYAGARDDFACAAPTRSWDTNSQTPWAAWYSPVTGDPCGANYGSWRQLYYDDPTSLALKYDLVNAHNLGGVGIWELGFQGTQSDLWRALAARFSITPTSFYFAEGFTGAGFTETLSLLMPNQSGSAAVTYFTESGALPPVQVALSQGKPTVVDVNAAVGANHSVAARVDFPGPGVAQRSMHFNADGWHGSTAQTGVTQPSREWDFAEGSTHPAYSEYLSLENFNDSAVPATLIYQTDQGAHPTKGLTLPALSRTTVEVMSGDLSSKPTCTPGAGGTCGVGRGIGGVSVQVEASLPIVAERPMYVNGFSFGSGAIRDGHDAFGVNAPNTQWNFAEGTTIGGFNEFLTLQNPGTARANVTLNYVTSTGGATTKGVTVAPLSRFTVPVFGSQYGVGGGMLGVSVQVSSDQPIVAERPMYLVHDFGTGPVAGATDVTGATGFGQWFVFPQASSAAGENDYLTIQNAGDPTALISITYSTPSGPLVKVFVVPGHTRHTVLIFDTAEGIGPGVNALPITVVSEQPILVEIPSYSTNASNYGATDTLGYMPVNF